MRLKRENLTRRLTIRLSERHYVELAAYAHEEGFDAATVIRHLIARFVADRDRAYESQFRREVLEK